MRHTLVAVARHNRAVGVRHTLAVVEEDIPRDPVEGAEPRPLLDPNLAYLSPCENSIINIKKYLYYKFCRYKNFVFVKTCMST